MQTLARSSTLDLLGLPGKKSQRALTPIRGVPTNALDSLGNLLGLSPIAIAELAGMPSRTYHRRKEKNQLLNPSESDAALRIGRIIEEAKRVFGDTSRAVHWLTTMNPILDNQPIQLLTSDAGTQAVQDELIRIHWGDTA